MSPPPMRTSQSRAVLAGSRVLAALVLAAAVGPRLEAGETAKPSYFTKLWELDAAARHNGWAFTPYKTTYILPYTSNSSPNQEAFAGLEPPRTLMKSEAVFQLGFKARLWRDACGGRFDLWLGYSQKAFWQVYDVDESAPFREIDHEPELIASFRTRFRVLGLDGRFVQVALSHQSNGLAKPLSRNWNRLIARAGLERGPLSLLLTGWVRVLFKPGRNENPGLTRYMGYGELQAFYFCNKHRIGIRFRDNLNLRFNRAAVQADWSFPLFARIGGIVQAFFGYGESLLDFDHRVSRVGMGIVLRDWD
jgi:phospholipase A1